MLWDSFVVNICQVEMWHDEQHRVEERMRSLFVGSDANADGNLDFEEFIAMIKHIKTNRPRREMLKMFAVLLPYTCVPPLWPFLAQLSFCPSFHCTASLALSIMSLQTQACTCYLSRRLRFCRSSR